MNIITCRTRLLCNFPYTTYQHSMYSFFSKMQQSHLLGTGFKFKSTKPIFQRGKKMLSLNQTYLPVITYHLYLLKSFPMGLSKLCPPRHFRATFIFMIEDECDSKSYAPKSNLDLNCLTFLTVLQES